MIFQNQGILGLQYTCRKQWLWIFRLEVLSRVRTIRPKLGVFSKMFKIQLFCCFITQLVKKLQQWSLYEVIEDILPFVFNTKQPPSDIYCNVLSSLGKGGSFLFIYYSACKKATAMVVI